MRGDFSRITFNHRNGYTAVMSQQGRVALDADANEQCFIDDYLRGVESVDVIGKFGGPANDAGFEISVVDGEIVIGPGRYYVDGLLCENPASLSYDSQPYLLDPTPSGADLLTELEPTAGTPVIQLYLQAWQRFVTPLDDPCLREPALGQADTTGRLQTVWRVVGTLQTNVQSSSTGEPPGLSPCCQAMYVPGGTGSTGTMSAQTTGADADCGCQPVPAAGYQGIENQLYRVEIHQGGDETTATCRWSRENGSVVSAVTAISGPNVTVNSLGPDANLGFQPQQWVELSDDNDLFGQTPNQPGSLYQIQSIQPADVSMTLSGSVTPVNPAQNARVRRWDQSGPSASATGIPLSAGSPIPLENGIEVCFSKGNYQSGDYWTITARTATGAIEWPPCDSDGNAYQSPHSMQVNQAPLGCIHWTVPRFQPLDETALTPDALRTSTLGDTVGSIKRGPVHGGGHYTVDDCRLLFQPLTAKPRAIYVESVSWTNDDVTTLEELLVKGLTIDLSQAPTSPISGANFIVTLEAIEVQFAREQAIATPFATTVGSTEAPSTLLRAITILDSEINVDGQSLKWVLPWAGAPDLQQETVRYINQLLQAGVGAGGALFARMRITLPGEMIFATGDSGSIFLDGRAFGELGNRADGDPRINLNVPTNSGAVASDLNGWFSLAPMPQVHLVAPANSELTAQTAPDGTVTANLEQSAIVTLNYPAVASPGELSLSLSGNPSTPVATIPSTWPLDIGQPTVNVPITIVGNPRNNAQVTLTINAQYIPKAGPEFAAQTATFTVTGTPPTASTSRRRAPSSPPRPRRSR